MRLGKYIAGAISGLTFGLLFAPKKGEDLRDEIMKKGKKSKQEGFSVLVEAFKEAGIEALDEARKVSENDTVEAAIGHSKEKMKEYFSQIEKTGYDIAARAKEKMEELQDAAMDTSDYFKKSAVKKAKAVQKSVVAKSKKTVAKVKGKMGDMMHSKSVAKKAMPKKTKKPMVTKTIKTTVKKISKKKK